MASALKEPKFPVGVDRVQGKGGGGVWEPGGKAPPLAQEKQGGLPGRSNIKGRTERTSKS